MTLKIEQRHTKAASDLLLGPLVGGGDGNTYVVRTPTHAEAAQAFAKFEADHLASPDARPKKERPKGATYDLNIVEELQALAHRNNTYMRALAYITDLETDNETYRQTMARIAELPAETASPDARVVEELREEVDTNLHDQIGDRIEEAGEHFVAGRTTLAAHLLREAANFMEPRSTAEPFAWTEGVAWHKPAHRAVLANVKLGAWMSAALDDPNVCEAMKADIREWFSAGEPMETLCQALAALTPTEAQGEGER